MDLANSLCWRRYMSGCVWLISLGSLAGLLPGPTAHHSMGCFRRCVQAAPRSCRCLHPEDGVWRSPGLVACDTWERTCERNDFPGGGGLVRNKAQRISRHCELRCWREGGCACRCNEFRTDPGSVMRGGEPARSHAQITRVWLDLSHRHLVRPGCLPAGRSVRTAGLRLIGV